MAFDFLPRADELPTPDLRKPAEGSARVNRRVRKLKAKGAIEKTVTEVDRETARADREIRFHCFLRDHRRCRAFKTLLRFDGDDGSPKTAWNHHIQFRSEHVPGADEPWNRLTLSWKAHKMIHDRELEIVEPANANEAVTFRQYTFKNDGSREFLREWVSQP